MAETNINALLKDASYVPDTVTLEENNPIENVPTVSVGKEIQKGTVIAGYYDSSREVETKRGKSMIHTLRLAKNGSKLAVWGKASLNLFFSKRQAGEFVKFTYTGLGKNEEGNDQHFFEFEVGTAH